MFNLSHGPLILRDLQPWSLSGWFKWISSCSIRVTEVASLPEVITTAIPKQPVLSMVTVGVSNITLGSQAAGPGVVWSHVGSFYEVLGHKGYEPGFQVGVP